jgi:ABC-2 type transport system permease protein
MVEFSPAAEENRMSRILALCKKETIDLFRQQYFVLLLILSPLLQVLIFGYVFRMDILHVPVQVVNLSSTMEAEHLTDLLTTSPWFKVTAIHRQPLDYVSVLRQGKVRAIILLTNQAGHQAAAGIKYPQVQVLLDGIDANTSQLVAGYVAGMMKDCLLQDLSRHGQTEPLTYRPLFRFNPLLRSLVYMGPALVGVLLTSLLILIGSVSLVREREQQTLDMLLILPLSPTELFIGKAIPIAVISLVSAGLGMGVILFWFSVPLHGSFLAIVITLLIYMPAVLSCGMLISIVTRTQQEALFFSWFAAVSFMVFSGFLTPIESMPKILQWVSRANPAFYLMRIIRGVFLQGIGLADFWPDLLILLVITGIMAALTLIIYHRSLHH